MKKTLKFAPHLISLVLSGSKTSTWRLFDDKNLQKGDLITLVKRPELTPFAEAEITHIVEKPFGKLTAKDKLGHEGYETEEKMYESYEKYYNKSVNRSTLVKIVKFKLLHRYN